MARIKVVYGLYQTEAPYLKEIVRVLAPVAEFLDHRQYQPQIAFDELPAGFLIAVLGAPEQCHGLLVFQYF